MLEQRRLDEQVTKPSLIVVPTSLVFNWLSEAAKFTPQIRILDHSHGARSKLVETFVDYHVVITTYGALRNGYYTRIAASPSRAMDVQEIYQAIEEFRTAARNAVLAGIDGVEIHAANGYLPQQFLSSHVNRRGDEFGGSLENRARFLRLVIEAVLEELSAQQIGVRLSPFALYNNAIDGDTHRTYTYVAQMLNEYGVGYVHAADTNAWGGIKDMPQILDIVRPNFHGMLVANGGLTFEDAEKLIASGRADVVAFGRQYIANPDLVMRVAQGGPFNEPDPSTFYGGDHVGYTDYPSLS